MAHTLPDQAARKRALDPTQSFIVQAPAGSGKTALLIARILSLLATCQQPEQILAITFTRKAANEMRERIIKALQSTHMDAPEAPHALTLWALAQKAMQQDQRQQWQLLENPNRLRIQTIDAFCAQVTQQMPITSDIGGQPGMLTQATPLYEQAADALLYQPDANAPWHQALCTLLLHLDGNILTTKRLWVTMLGCRDQWLPYLVGHQDPNQLKCILERSLGYFVKQQLEILRELLPRAWQAPLQQCLDYSHHMLKADGDPSIPQPSETPETNTLAYWQQLTSLLLTSQHQWRKTVTKKQGFYAANHFSSKEDKEKAKSMKSLIKDILNDAFDHDALRCQLQLIAMVPSAGFNTEEWPMIEALGQLLPVLAAQLSLLFKQQGMADFTEVSIKALQALASHDSPSDISLALDRRIEHILIDEFQDTSITQFRLLEALTLGWQTDDGRTLFVVGDPMQSIYRFRQAEVSLFEQLKRHGIHHIKPQFLSLCTNFRSHPNIVEWINTQCQAFFPTAHQADTGAVPFSPAVTPVDSGSLNHTALAQCHLCTGSELSQAKTIVELIQVEKARNTESNIAILVRSRSHLHRIIPQLESANIAYQAVDIQSLAGHVIVQDLISLTRAISHLADRTAWFAILRAPWCGLSLDDMLTIAKDPETSTIWQQINDPETQGRLSNNGLMRLKRILAAINNAVLQRGRSSLRDAIAKTWHALGGPYSYSDPQPDLIADAYLDHLEAFLKENSHYSPSVHLQALQALYAPNPSPEAHAVQIMTIHKSKGLEFDCVIIPDCQRSGAHDAQQLMLWQQNITAQQHHLMLAPMPQKHQTQTCYKLLQYLEKCKQANEVKRLLYVAITRAKHRIHCLAQPKQDHDDATMISAPKGSLMALLAPAFQSAQQHHHTSAIHHDNDQPGILRLNDAWRHPTPAVQHELDYGSANRYIPEPTSLPSIIGTVVHRILWRLSKATLATPSASCLASQKPYWQQLLQHHQCPEIHYTEALFSIETCIKNTLDDPQGQWILQPHLDAQSEVAITSNTRQGYIEHIIDRTFIDDGKRWIIDYKCATCDTSINQFIQSQYQKYRPQLEHYGNIYHEMDTRPIMLGLYFPHQKAWHAWPYHADHAIVQTQET